MHLYPIFLDIKGRPVLVVGGGRVAERKVLSLLEADALVTVVSPTLTQGLKKLARARGSRRISHVKGSYKAGMITGGAGEKKAVGLKKTVAGIKKAAGASYVLVISATSSKGTNEKVFKEASSLSIPVNVVDKPALCTFHVPALVKRGPVRVAISTSGESPYLARTLREDLEEAVPRELAAMAEVMGAVRRKLLKQGAKNDKKTRIYAEMTKGPLLGLISEGSGAGIDSFLKGLLGPGFTLAKLGVKLKKRQGRAGGP